MTATYLLVPGTFTSVRWHRARAFQVLLYSCCCFSKSNDNRHALVFLARAAVCLRRLVGLIVLESFAPVRIVYIDCCCIKTEFFLLSFKGWVGIGPLPPTPIAKHPSALRLPRTSTCILLPPPYHLMTGNVRGCQL